MSARGETVLQYFDAHRLRHLTLFGIISYLAVEPSPIFKVTQNLRRVIDSIHQQVMFGTLDKHSVRFNIGEKVNYVTHKPYYELYSIWIHNVNLREAVVIQHRCSFGSWRVKRYPKPSVSKPNPKGKKPLKTKLFDIEIKAL